jgi:ribosomal protein S24E
MSFCKIEDSNNNLYILTDKNKQPLLARDNTCFIPNGKKFLDNPELIDGKKFRDSTGDLFENSFFYNTKIPFILKNDEAIVNKLDIDFNIYDIAKINKDIVIIDYNNKQYTGKDIEKNYRLLYFLDNNNKDYTYKMLAYANNLENKGEEMPLDVISNNITIMYDYYQDLLIKEDITKVTLSSNNMYIGIFVFFILFIFVIAFGYWVFKPNY